MEKNENGKETKVSIGCSHNCENTKGDEPFSFNTQDFAGLIVLWCCWVIHLCKTTYNR